MPDGHWRQLCPGVEEMLKMKIYFSNGSLHDEDEDDLGDVIPSVGTNNVNPEEETKQGGRLMLELAWVYSLA
eukprot:8086016-Prorocentrum_lima.AAC.1